MLTLVSGNPGNGKTLFTVTTIEKMRLEEGREVYQDGIPDLTYAWKQLPTVDYLAGAKGRTQVLKVPDWSQVPDGSIVVIDEAWRVFPVRSQGALVPEYVQWLATHRHRGVDLFLATQTVSKQLDTFVRGLVGKHYHLDRKFGMSYAMLYEWERVADPTSTTDLNIAQNRRWVFPKETFGAYKSAVEHTHKMRLPWRKFAWLGGALVMTVGCFWYALHTLGSRGHVQADGKLPGSLGAASAGSKPFDGQAFWVRDRIERVKDLPASAPVFDPLQKVVSQPRIEGCMQLAIGHLIRCECTGPNHAVLDMSTDACVSAVKKGWFDETRKYADAKVANVAQLNALDGVKPETAHD